MHKTGSSGQAVITSRDYTHPNKKEYNNGLHPITFFFLSFVNYRKEDRVEKIEKIIQGIPVENGERFLKKYYFENIDTVMVAGGDST